MARARSSEETVGFLERLGDALCPMQQRYLLVIPFNPFAVSLHKKTTARALDGQAIKMALDLLSNQVKLARAILADAGVETAELDGPAMCQALWESYHHSPSLMGSGLSSQVVLDHAGDTPVAGVLFDLGVSSPQLDEAARGFSFTKDGPLDMRMDPSRGEPVSAWLACAPVDEMREVIATLGEERFARRVAAAIAAARARAPIERTHQLAQIVAGAVRSRDGKHPATRTFQALRMHVNDELGQLGRGLAAAVDVLAPGGRLAVISFHSLEDRATKEFMRRESGIDPVLARLPIVPPHAAPRLRLVGSKRKATDAEVAANPRARSAVLRVAERTA